LKEFIDAKFLKSIDAFVSSHEESLKLGDDWLSTIKNSLSECILMVVICSPISVQRPWINFEAGAGWVNKIPVVPLCHSGLLPGDLPVPIKSFQAGVLSKRGDIKKLFKRISQLINITPPTIGDDEFFKTSAKFEAEIKTSILIKDTTFIHNLLFKHLGLLKFSICASVLDYNEMNEIDFNKKSLFDFSISFNKIHRLHNMSLLPSNYREKVYQVFQKTVNKINESIKFILSNANLRIAPELKELLEAFLFKAAIIDEWSNNIATIDLQPKDNNIKKTMIQAVQKEQLPPQKTRSNPINHYIDYYSSLDVYKDLCNQYDLIMSKLLNNAKS